MAELSPQTLASYWANWIFEIQRGPWSKSAVWRRMNQPGSIFVRVAVPRFWTWQWENQWKSQLLNLEHIRDKHNQVLKLGVFSMAPWLNYSRVHGQVEDSQWCFPKASCLGSAWSCPSLSRQKDWPETLRGPALGDWTPWGKWLLQIPSGDQLNLTTSTWTQEEIHIFPDT